jgi:hypothetical protein
LVEITVDGAVLAPLHLSNGTQTYPLVSGLALGNHDIEIAKRTESFIGITRFDNFVGATLLATPRSTKLIEFIGDSITAGYGTLGVDPCQFLSSTQAETQAWAAFAARELGAAHHAIAYSGIGMYRNCCGGAPNVETMPLRYLRTLADRPDVKWDFSTKPDIPP